MQLTVAALTMGANGVRRCRRRRFLTSIHREGTNPGGLASQAGGRNTSSGGECVATRLLTVGPADAVGTQRIDDQSPIPTEDGTKAGTVDPDAIGQV